MKEITNYELVFERLVQKTKEYVVSNNIQAMILGISGGIDSTIVAAICYEVSVMTGIPLIGRSLPTKFNKEEETTTATLVGKAFCTDFQTVHIGDWYKELSSDFRLLEGEMTPIAKGNIQARLRMMYLYNLASIHKGIVMDTDNLTENNLGYWTLHGDVGDFNPIGCLWKTEIFKLAEVLIKLYGIHSDVLSHTHGIIRELQKIDAVAASLRLKPTAGLGITNNDLEELGAESYDQVDAILQEILAWKWLSNERGDFPESIKEQREMFLDEQQMLCYPIEVILNITNRHFNSEFKRKKMPIKIERDSIV
jgi:NAD+ synthetase